jgi:hypothetical protein
MYTGKFTGEQGIDEIINQIMITRGIVSDNPGHVHFSAKALLDTSATLNRALLQGPYRKQALVPTSPWLDDKAPQKPDVKMKTVNDSLLVSWSHSDPNEVFLWICYFEIEGYWEYRIFEQGKKEFIFPGIITIENRDGDKKEIKINHVAVSAVDRTGNESWKVVLKTGL